MGARVCVVNGHSGDVLGDCDAQVGMKTTRGEIIAVSPKGYTTKDKDGWEYRYAEPRIGIAATITKTEAKRWGWA